MSHPSLILLCLGLAFHSATAAPEVRIWSTVEGKRIEASLLKVDGDKVTLQHKNSSKTVTVSREDLMPTDTIYLDDLAKNGKGLPGNKSEPKSGEPSPSSDAGGGTAEGFAKSGLYPRTKEEIRAGLKEILKREKPKSAGKDQHAAICRLNTYRFLSGVPFSVTADPDMVEGAADAAAACDEAGTLSHELERSTDKCDLSLGDPDMLSSVDSYMEDSGDNNRNVRGHRRWCLNPPMEKTGFGRKGKYGAMWSIDQSGTKSEASWSYPGRGLYPVEYWRGNAWSFYMPAALPEDAKVRIWKLTAAPKLAIPWEEAPKGREISIGFSNVSDNSIVFEPDSNVIGRRGIYWVRIEGTDLREQYVTELF